MSFWKEFFGIQPPRATLLEKRSITQAYASAMNTRLTADFAGSNSSADSALLGSLEKMRNRARDLERNEPLVRHFLDLNGTNVIGPQGMKLQVKAKNNQNDDLDEQGNEIIESAWKVFSMYGNCTPCGQFSIRSLSKMALNGTLRDGEAFFQIVFGREYPHGFAVHAFEPDRIDELKNLKLNNGNRVRMGVEINPYGRPVAYWLRRNHPGDYQVTTDFNYSEEERVPADNIIHVKLARRVGQTRGEPSLVPVISTFKMINGHREAELVAARTAASKMGFFTSEAGDQFPGDGTDSDGAMMMNIEPGVLTTLPPGMNFVDFDPKHPSGAFADFQRGVLMSTAAGLGMSYEALTGDVSGVSYSSLRQVAIAERDHYTEVQEWFKEQFMMRVYARWLRHVMEFGFIRLPVSAYEKFLSASMFRCRGWKWVDPQKEVTALEAALHNGLISLTAAADQMGTDLDETFAQIQREKQMAERYNVSIAFEPFGLHPGKKADSLIEDESEE